MSASNVFSASEKEGEDGDGWIDAGLDLDDEDLDDVEVDNDKGMEVGERVEGD